jgi:eukaryotic-like serine/threonine-protein kinase
LAYTSEESGVFEVYVESFPNPRSRQKISTAGGREPVWAPSGDELFSVAGCPSRTEATTQCLFAVAFREGFPPSVGRPRLLAEIANVMQCGPNRCYDVGSGGRRFVLTLLEPPRPPASTPSTREMHVILNWFEELKAKVPPAR